MLLSIGMNSTEEEDSHTSWALDIAKTISILEHHDGTDSLGAALNSRRATLKMLTLSTSSIISGRRDALKFFSKRVPCSCLKQRHQQARKTIPKIGRCMGCWEETERAALSICSRCMITQYCSRECQVAYWHEHEDACDRYKYAMNYKHN